MEALGFAPASAWGMLPRAVVDPPSLNVSKSGLGACLEENQVAGFGLGMCVVEHQWTGGQEERSIGHSNISVCEMGLQVVDVWLWQAPLGWKGIVTVIVEVQVLHSFAHFPGICCIPHGEERTCQSPRAEMHSLSAWSCPLSELVCSWLSRAF